MNNANNASTSKGFNQSGSSFLEVAGLDSLRTQATFSSTIRDMNDVEEPRSNMQPIYEEPLYTASGDTVTELCATCSLSGIKKEATHFCPGCDRRGRYICGDKCLKDHSMWCKGPQHEVQSLSMDMHSDSADPYTTIKSSRGSQLKTEKDSTLQTQNGPPGGAVASADVNYLNCIPEPRQLAAQRTVSSWLLNETNADGSEGSGYTVPKTEDSSHGYDVTSSVDERPIPRLVRGRNVQPNWILHSDEYHSEDTYSMSHDHIYEMPPIRHGIALPNVHHQNVTDPRDWGNISTSTTRRLDMVYNGRGLQRAHKKDKKCVIQ